VDLTLDGMAPEHIAAGSPFEVRIGYFNFGTEPAPDAWVTTTLPAGTQFITATDRWGAPLPPYATKGDKLTWYFVSPACTWPDDARCGHILITLLPDETVPDDTALTTLATIATTAVESDATNNTVSVTSTVPAMAGSTKQVQARYVMSGDVLTYTLRISMAHRAGWRNERTSGHPDRHLALQPPSAFTRLKWHADQHADCKSDTTLARPSASGRTDHAPMPTGGGGSDHIQHDHHQCDCARMEETMHATCTSHDGGNPAARHDSAGTSPERSVAPQTQRHANRTAR
jgi:hypothetical protein